MIIKGIYIAQVRKGHKCANQCWPPLQLSDIIQVHKCTKNIKKKNTASTQADNSSCAEVVGSRFSIKFSVSVSAGVVDSFSCRMGADGLLSADRPVAPISPIHHE